PIEGNLVLARPVPPTGAPPHDDRAVRDRLDAEALEVVEPSAERFLVAGRVVTGNRLEPLGRMRDGVVAAEVEQPAVAASPLHPAFDVSPRIVGRVRPADEDVGDTAFAQELR